MAGGFHVSDHPRFEQGEGSRPYESESDKAIGELRHRLTEPARGERGAITGNLIGLQEDMLRLEKTVQVLHERLDPVLLGEMESNECADKRSPQNLSGMAFEIETLRERAQAATYRLQRLLDRVDI